MSSPVSTICGTCGKRYTWVEDTIEECPYCAKESFPYSNDEYCWVGRSFHFDSAHFLPGHFKCGVVHGHTWHVTVELYGRVKEEGMVVDLHELKRVVEEEIETFDHKLVNSISFFEKYPPTCENIATYLVHSLYSRFSISSEQMPKFLRIKIQEGEGGWAIAEA